MSLLRARLPRRTVRLRLALIFGLLFLVTGAGLVGITYFTVRYAVTNFQPQQAARAGRQIAPPGQATAPPGITGQGLQPGPPQQGAPQQGSPQQSSSPQGSPHPDASLQGLPPQGSPQEGTLLSSGSATRAALDHQRAVVLRQLWIASVIALGVMSVLSVLLGWIVAGRALRPLRTITATARRISATSLDQRLALRGPDDELKELGDTFDALLSRLQVAFEAQRRFVANASHELRTPLARQRALGQVALADPDATVDSLREAHERILAGGAQQERLIEALLTLARGQTGIEVHENFDLGQLTREVVLTRQPEADHLAIAVHTSMRPAVVAGHHNLAERLVTNLIDNALLHNHPGGRVDVTTAVVDGHPVLTVANTGPVVPPGAVDRLSQPFQRLGTERTARSKGLGLGLSIVHAIAHAHDGTVLATARPEGGLSVTVTFPPVPEPGPVAANPVMVHEVVRAPV
jgi:signal transduction histidine kinase